MVSLDPIHWPWQWQWPRPPVSIDVNSLTLTLAIYVVPPLILLFILRRPIRSLLIPRGIKGIPSLPDPKPIWGDLPLMGKMIADQESFTYFFDWCAKEMGPISQVRVGWYMSLVVVADIDTIESILLKPIGTFDRSSDITSTFGKIIPRALLTLQTNDVYKHHRRVIGTAMTSKYLARATPRAYESARELVGLWSVKRDKSEGRAWAVEVDMQGATMDAISAMAFGESLGTVADRTEQIQARDTWPTGTLGEVRFDTQDPAVAESILCIFDTLPIRSAFPTITHFFTRLTPSYCRHARTLDGYLKSKLAASRAKAKQLGPDNAAEMADNTLDLMVGRELKGDDYMSVGEMRDELYQYLLAGTETSSTTLSWWIKYMTNFPDVQRRLRTSILEAMPELQDRPPSFDDLTAVKLPYLEAVVQETLRLSRTAGGYSREVKHDTTILGYVVPKGTLVVMSTNSSYEDETTPMHTLGIITGEAPPLYPVQEKAGDLRAAAPEREAGEKNELGIKKVGKWAAGTGRMFNPDRWLKHGVFDPNAGPFLPFSLGQRGCFGKNLALMELRMFCLILNQAFFFAPVEAQQNGFQRKETVTSHPIHCFVRPLEWDAPEAAPGTVDS